MASLFTKIIDGDIPARFVYEDDICVAFLTIEPLSPGHTLVVPRSEVDHWLDLDPDIAAHLMVTAQTIGRAIQSVYSPTKVGMMIAGLEVAHVHVHVTQMNDLHDLDFSRADRSPNADDLDEAADLICNALRQ